MTVTPLSILDLSPISAGSDTAAALRNTVDLARHAEEWGYRRYQTPLMKSERMRAQASVLTQPCAQPADFADQLADIEAMLWGLTG